jgi:hypothetical protein
VISRLWQFSSQVHAAREWCGIKAKDLAEHLNRDPYSSPPGAGRTESTSCFAKAAFFN